MLPPYLDQGEGSKGGDVAGDGGQEEGMVDELLGHTSFGELLLVLTHFPTLLNLKKKKKPATCNQHDVTFVHLDTTV